MSVDDPSSSIFLPQIIGNLSSKITYKSSVSPAHVASLAINISKFPNKKSNTVTSSCLMSELPPGGGSSPKIVALTAAIQGLSCAFGKKSISGKQLTSQLTTSGNLGS